MERTADMRLPRTTNDGDVDDVDRMLTVLPDFELKDAFCDSERVEAIFPVTLRPMSRPSVLCSFFSSP